MASAVVCLLLTSCDAPQKGPKAEKNVLQDYVEVPLDKAKAVGGVAESHQQQLDQQLQDSSDVADE